MFISSDMVMSLLFISSVSIPLWTLNQVMSGLGMELAVQVKVTVLPTIWGPLDMGCSSITTGAGREKGRGREGEGGKEEKGREKVGGEGEEGERREGEGGKERGREDGRKKVGGEERERLLLQSGNLLVLTICSDINGSLSPLSHQFCITCE